LLSILIFIGVDWEQQNGVKVGLDVLVEKRMDLLRGKRIGIITNQTGISSDGRHIVDVLSKLSDIKIVALFAPEHGIRGEIPAGEAVATYTDSATGLPVFSLYGRTKRPTPEMLKGIDLLIFDIQDIGTRFYTYVSTMSLAMEAAADAGIEFIVLDRPNPITGSRVEGPVLEKRFSSFIGLHPIPIRHGMTVGELALLINGEGYLSEGRRVRLKVVPMENWRRSTWFDETGLPWIKPSPNIFSLESALLFPATGLLEGTNVSEGRGTYKTFQYVGAPWIDGEELTKELRKGHLRGVTFRPVTFIPEDIPGIAMNPKYEGQVCKGVFIQVTDREVFQPLALGIHLLCAIKKLYPSEFAWRGNYFDKLMGTDKVRLAIDRGENPRDILLSWRKELNAFKKIRRKYLLYP